LVRPRGSGYSGVLQASGWRRRGGSLRLGRRGRPIKKLIETVARFLCTLPEEQARELI
jgi:hypothetical protein